ncbi:MAG: photosystem I assembly protein Ycf4 [Synechococcus sp. SB0662_bin_45]|uniref:Photosystem I assembly protein Ycf4 n=1 Tax=Synechococcus sp. SB0676_bin_10 TaxID=2604869 RepID=A0A6B1FB94_9SYNE|nr:photosystem I assembly protein Ycf4 [Cyanobacteria bacterium MAG IRC3_bin_20]MCY3654351.1 photosystem I assembly protein Ycf4 [Cyanobacteria bacterium MAG IRC1_bin_28]MDE0648597.1 photosystem I assembly protein Ycf4 [Cyanobacteria bacterium MAG IRC4_bin_6]MXW13117.1 photosystem I assembly protein Ycf4 [Synechococcus sp. SB0668_bin_13]MXX08255.1 photosystem I assembly protein Ycf4 [Synechococcus sp. SB0667_bin_8]MXY62688.1 photosystem I assembly protein Ycf4 [Synechococcus sp. SB0665_bin_28]
MTIQATTHSERQILQTIQGSRRNSNVAVALITSLGGIGFLLASASSFWQLDLLPAGQPSQLLFVPQGLVMGLYGIAGSLLALYFWIGIVLDVGSGENCFNQDSGRLTVRRRGFRRWIEVDLPLDDIQAVKVDIREGLNPRRRLALKLRSRRDLPLTGVGQPMALAELEASGARLASFLNVPLQGLN